MRVQGGSQKLQYFGALMAASVQSKEHLPPAMSGSQ